MVGLQYFFTQTIRTNAAIGGARPINPSYTSLYGSCVGNATAGICSSVNKPEWAGSVNLIWSPIRAVDLGLEYQHVERTLQARSGTAANSTSGGVANRIQFTAIGRF